VGSASLYLFYYEFSFVTAHYYYNAAMVSLLHLSAFFMNGEQGACSVTQLLYIRDRAREEENESTNKSKSKWTLLFDFFVVSSVISCTVLHTLPLDGRRAAGLVDTGSVLAFCHCCAAAQSEVVHH